MAVLRMGHLVIKSYLVPSHQLGHLGPDGARNKNTHKQNEEEQLQTIITTRTTPRAHHREDSPGLPREVPSRRDVHTSSSCRRQCEWSCS